MQCTPEVAIICCPDTRSLSVPAPLRGAEIASPVPGAVATLGPRLHSGAPAGAKAVMTGNAFLKHLTPLPPERGLEADFICA